MSVPRRRRAAAMLLASLSLLPLTGFACYQTYDPCDPPCTDNNATLNIFLGHYAYHCCNCPPNYLRMTVWYIDAATNGVIGKSDFTNVGSGFIATTNPVVPTCKDLIVPVKFNCRGWYSPNGPTYVDTFVDVSSIPCGEQRNITVDIQCASIAKPGRRPITDRAGGAS